MNIATCQTILFGMLLLFIGWALATHQHIAWPISAAILSVLVLSRAEER